MAIIYSYPEIGSVHNDDLFIISRTSSDNKTFSLKASELFNQILGDFSIGIAGDTGTGTIANTQTLSVLGTAGQIQTTASGQDITLSIDPSFLPASVVTGTGTTNTLPLWSDGPNGVVSDSIVTQTVDIANNITGLKIFNSAAAINYFFGGNEFSSNSFNFKSNGLGGGFYTPNFRFATKITVDRDSHNNTPSLDVGDINHNYAAAWFRNGVVISNSPTTVQVDNTSLAIGGANNDIISGSDHCLIVGNGNQILSNSDQSVAFGQGNTITGSKDSLAVGNSNTVDSAQRVYALGYNNTIDSASSFVAGGDNNVVGDNTNIVLGYNNSTTLSQNFVIGNELTGSGNAMVLGYRNDPSSYPTPNASLGLGETKFVVAAGSGTTVNSNALLITEGGKQSGGVNQIPRVIMPSIVNFDYTDDTDAAANGIPAGGIYHNSGELRIRIA